MISGKLQIWCSLKKVLVGLFSTEFQQNPMKVKFLGCYLVVPNATFTGHCDRIARLGTHTHERVRARTHTRTHSYTHKRFNARTHTHTYTRELLLMHVRTYAHIHTHILARAHAHEDPPEKAKYPPTGKPPGQRCHSTVLSQLCYPSCVIHVS